MGVAELIVVVLLITIHMFITMSTASSSPSVIVIGAGMSGISTGHTLHEAGIHDILILEATNHVGGRMHKKEFGGYTIEVGANWVQGVGDPETINPIWEIANKINLTTFYSDYGNLSSNSYQKKGGLYPKHIAKLAEDASQKSLKSIWNLSKSLSHNNRNDISVSSSQALFNYYPTTPLEMVMDYYLFDYEDSEPPRITSLTKSEPLPTYEDFGEDQYFVADKRGYESVVHYVAKQFLSYDKHGNITDSRLKLNKVVRVIDSSQEGVKVITEDGSIYHSTYVIISASLGVLQSNLIEFKPQLPKWKRLALHQFDMTLYTKIFLKFPSKFWPSGNPGTEFFLYAHDMRGYYPVWQHFENEYPGSNILMVTIVDDEARRIEKQTDEETKEELMEVLRNMFGTDIPNATDILVPRWWADRFFKGTFSNWPTGFTQRTYDLLRAPIGGGKIRFTGEYTNEKYYAYVHGAYLAGIDSAKKLINCMKKGNCGEINHPRQGNKNN